MKHIQKGASLLLAVLLAFGCAGLPAYAEAPSDGGTGLARILTAEDSLFAVDESGTVWAWGEGGYLLGLSGGKSVK